MSLSPHEQFLLSSYLLNMFKAAEEGKDRAAMFTVAQWAEYATAFLSDDEKHIYDMPQKSKKGSDKKEKKTTGAETEDKTLKDFTQDDFAALRTHLETLHNFCTSQKQTDPRYTFVRDVFAKMGMDDGDQDIAELLLCAENTIFKQYFSIAETNNTFALKIPQTVAQFLGKPTADIQRRLKQSAPLFASGLAYTMSRDSDGDPIIDFLPIHLHEKLIDLIDMDELDPESVLEKLIGQKATPKLDISDFDYVHDTAQLAIAIIRGASREKTKGINILIEGATGVGKTELAKVLAAAAGVSLYAVGERFERDDDSWGEQQTGEQKLSPVNRVADMRLVQSVLRQTDSPFVLLFDEAQDILGDHTVTPDRGKEHRGTRVSKVSINRMLEENTGVVIYTTNDVRQFDPAFLRRFSLIVTLRTPDLKARQRLFERVCTKHGQNLSPSTLTKLATDFDVPPGQIETSVRAATLAGFSEERLRAILKPAAMLNPNASLLAAFAPVSDYDLSLINTPHHDMVAVTDQIVRSGHLDLHMCLWGEPGTGKSEYALYLAHRMGLDPWVVSYSDLARSHIGETEQNIRQMFMIAAEEKKFLIINEGDSLLQDRRFAKNSWEVTGVNEMLTCMERHPHPVVVTTNLKETLDPAALRRFALNFEFRPFTPDQLKRAFRMVFNHDLAASQRPLPDNLAMGDLTAAKKTGRFLGFGTDPDALLRAAIDSANTRRLGKPIGFSASLS